jgi:branched-chain amino acid transport system permease protein
MLGQLLVNGVSAAAIYLLVGLSFSLVYATAGFFSFAHAALIAVAAYATLAFHAGLGFPFLIAIVPGIASSILLGALIEASVLRHVRRIQTSPLMPMLASLGIYIAIQNVLSLLSGDDAKGFAFAAGAGVVDLMGTRVTVIQLAAITTSFACFAALWLMLKATRVGLGIRALAGDATLAYLSGLDRDRAILVVWVLAGALAGIAGILIGLDVQMTPTMGINPLLMGIVAAVVGGIGSIQGLAFGALLLGLAQHLAVSRLGGDWQDAMAFFVLLVFLLARPQGFLGETLRKATV